MTDRSIPENLVRLFTERANAGDLDGLVDLYEPGAVLAVGSPVANGHDEIRKFYADLLARKSNFPPAQPLPAVYNGDLAMTVTPLPKGRCSVEVARRQADGGWRWIIDQLKVELSE